MSYLLFIINIHKALLENDKSAINIYCVCDSSWPYIQNIWILNLKKFHFLRWPNFEEKKIKNDVVHHNSDLKWHKIAKLWEISGEKETWKKSDKNGSKWCTMMIGYGIGYGSLKEFE